jgi:hypothetical protein
MEPRSNFFSQEEIVGIARASGGERIGASVQMMCSRRQDDLRKNP